MGRIVALGVRVKSGRAIVVVVDDSRLVVSRREVPLRDPQAPLPWQPYHAVMDLPWEQAEDAMQGTKENLRVVARRTFEEIAEALREKGFEIRGVAIVGGSKQHPSRIGNPHIRAHAAEGRLFRDAAEAGAEACGGVKAVFAEGELRGSDVENLGLIKPASGPWRADEKEAACAAWTILSTK